MLKGTKVSRIRYDCSSTMTLGKEFFIAIRHPFDRSLEFVGSESHKYLFWMQGCLGPEGTAHMRGCDPHIFR